jgi:5-deoxy-glucuronate isomerase
VTSQWVLPRGSAAGDGWDVVVDDRVDGWAHTGLYAGSLQPGERRTVATGSRELAVVPLSGGVVVRCTDAAGDRHTAELAGRPSVFAGPSDVAYVPRGSELTLESAAGCRVALVLAALTGSPGASPPFRHVAADDVPVELRGAGPSSREVRNFGVPGVLDAERLIACEVVTPAGNWSSYPPHKHDEHRAGLESELEEIYYVEVQTEAGAPSGPDADPMAYLRVYGTADRPIDVLAEVRSGDVVLVPFGWHGPAMAVPGYDLYYLNVMAGPTHGTAGSAAERAWLITDDPAHGWVRDTWAAQPVDPRLPLRGTR